MIWLALAGCDDAGPPPPPVRSTDGVEAPAPVVDSRLPPDLAPFVPLDPPFEVVDAGEDRARLKFAVAPGAVLAAFAARTPGGMVQHTEDRLVLSRWMADDGRPALGTVSVKVENDGEVEVALDPPLADLGLAPSERCGPDRIEVTTEWPAGGTASVCVDPASRRLDGEFALDGDGAHLVGRYQDGRRTGEWTLGRGTAVIGRGTFAADRPVGAWTVGGLPVTFGDDGRPVGAAPTVLEDGQSGVGLGLGLGVVGAKLEAGEVVLSGWFVVDDAKECRYPGAPDPRAFVRFAVVGVGALAPVKVLDIGRASTDSAACSTAPELAADRVAVEALLASRGVDPLVPVRSVPFVAGAPPVAVGAHQVALAIEGPAKGPAAWFDDPDLLGRAFTWGPHEQWSAVALTVDGKPVERIFTHATRGDLVVDGSRYAMLYDGRLLGAVRSW